MSVAQKARRGYMWPYPWFENPSPPDCESNRLPHLPAEQEPTRKMGYYQTNSQWGEWQISDDQESCSQGWSQGKPKAFILHSSRCLEIVRQESKCLPEAVLSQVQLVFLNQISSIWYKLDLFLSIYTDLSSTHIHISFPFPTQLQSYGHQYLPWLVPIAPLYIFRYSRSSNQLLSHFQVNSSQK